MKGFLTQNQIEYVLAHLEQNIEIPKELKNLFVFERIESYKNSGKIVFKQSEDELDLDHVNWIDDIPLLFPNDTNNKIYSINSNGLTFHHDIFKSAFYLLSGYQELRSNDLDSFGRFKYANSIQKKLGIVHKPIVNYYFEMIGNGLQDYAKIIGLNVESKQLFKKFGFFLTHDIDNVDYYTVNRFLYKIKELTGLSKSYFSTKSNIKQLFKITYELLRFSKKENPVWNFNYLLELEDKHKFRSAFYFLPKDKKHHDSQYNFNEKRIQSLFNLVKKRNCEIGIHGTVATVENLTKLNEIINDLKANSFIKELGIRQHRLLYNLPKTTIIHEKAGLMYDTTVGFAEHEGFRNSYCLPFKLYDFKNDRPIHVWEIPLNVMDVTLFHYRGLNNNTALAAINQVIEEVAKFNGVFTLLWHNDFFDEERYPMIKDFYENLLLEIKNQDPECMLGPEIVKRIST